MTEQERLENFMLETGQSEDTFNYYKNIFSTWSNDLDINYTLFCAHGLKPMKTDDLIFMQSLLTEMLQEIESEIQNR